MYLRGFSFSINMANFEAFHRTKKLISNLFFLKSEIQKYIQVGCGKSINISRSAVYQLFYLIYSTNYTSTFPSFSYYDGTMVDYSNHRSNDRGNDRSNHDGYYNCYHDRYYDGYCDQPWLPS